MTSLAVQNAEKEKTIGTDNITKKKADMSRLHSLYNDEKTRREKRKETRERYEKQTG